MVVFQFEHKDSKGSNRINGAWRTIKASTPSSFLATANVSVTSLIFLAAGASALLWQIAQQKTQRNTTAKKEKQKERKNKKKKRKKKK